MKSIVVPRLPETNRIGGIRHGIAWACCFCFFFMIPLEFASLEWMKTEKGTWLIFQARELPSWIAVLSLFWSLAVIGTAGLFLLTGGMTRFAFEKEQLGSEISSGDVVYYTAWVQTLSVLASLLVYLFPIWEENIWYPYLPHFWMVFVALFLFRHRLSSLGLRKPDKIFWFVAPLLICLIYGWVYFFLDSWITEPVARFFSLELASWREDSISQRISQAEQTGWMSSLGQLMVLGCLGPIAEECLFRGVLQQAIARSLGAGMGILFSATLFALFHVDVALLAPLFVLGLILSGMRAYFKNLWAPILFHAVNNSAAVILDWIGRGM